MIKHAPYYRTHEAAVDAVVRSGENIINWPAVAGDRGGLLSGAIAALEVAETHVEELEAACAQKDVHIQLLRRRVWELEDATEAAYA